MHEYFFEYLNTALFVTLWGHSGVVVSVLDLRSEGRWFDASPCHCVVSLDKILCPHCLSSPRFINEYRRHAAGE